MFNLSSMLDDYKQRKIARYEKGDVFVSTAAVSDSDNPYETAVSHPLYKDNKLIIVEEYTTKKDAKAGHAKWVKIMTAEVLPASITDVSTAGIILLGKAILGDEFNSEPHMRQDFLD